MPTTNGEWAARRDERISLRVSARMKAVWEQAAALNGTTLAEFIRLSSQRGAMDAILAERVLRLSTRDSLVFAEALRHPPAPNDQLLASVERHRELFSGRDGGTARDRRQDDGNP